MSTTSSRLSDLVSRCIALFEQLTGYFIVNSLGLPCTMRLDPTLKRLEITPNLDDMHLLACLVTAYKRLGCPTSPDFLTSMAGFSGVSTEVTADMNS